MNKIGADKMISVYWFAILLLVAGGIFAMVYAFYQHPYDVRELEADIMINKIADCLSNKGELNSELVKQGEFNENFKTDFLSICNLNFNVEDEYSWEDDQYYVEINFYIVGDTENSVFEISKGNNKWISSCETQKEKEYNLLAKCVEKRFYSLDENENQYLIKILSVVRKTEKNAR
jgi:hypothetical protein